ncbi:MAG: Ig-like domain-containing protein [Bryobacteraceae bacterium]
MKASVVLVTLALLIGLGLTLFADDNERERAISPSIAAAAAVPHVIAWNDLGMHCMDKDYSVFSVLPPFNILHVQVIDASGHLVKNGTTYTVNFQGTKDPTGSINTTSAKKTNFWQYVLPIFGVSLPVDSGLAGMKMPGSANTGQPLVFNAVANEFEGTGIPIIPIDNAGKTNTYPLVRVNALSGSTVVAGTVAVLPVSTEMTCIKCHASNSVVAAMPPGGWVNYTKDADKDYKLNILKLHDAKPQNAALYQQALVTAGYPNGLLKSAMAGNPPLCAKCHLSNALAPYGITGVAGVPPLTASEHGFHANVVDPSTGQTLEANTDRAACYTCHPGSTTRCLRGAMGSAVASDGSLAIQCQSCHGSMSKVGTATRAGWLDEPNCQACHTGTAVQNNGQIRYSDVFETNGQMRVAVNNTFATNPNNPSPGYSLFKVSSGHGGLQCEACHGSTHAEYPAAGANDNLGATKLQGHAGVLVECQSCHNTMPNTSNGGPHGMHSIGQSWVSGHQNAAEGNKAICQTCHGTDYRGTVLSYAQGDRSLSAFGTKTFWRGFQVGCYNCHNGPNSDDRNSNSAPLVTNASVSTTGGTSAQVTLKGSDANGNSLTWRIVSQPANGTVGLSGNVATYFPAAGFKGTETFTFAAWDGQTNSNLGTITMTVN